MKTKLKTMIGVLRSNTGRGNRVQPKLTLSKFLAVCIFVILGINELFANESYTLSSYNDSYTLDNTTNSVLNSSGDYVQLLSISNDNSFNNQIAVTGPLEYCIGDEFGWFFHRTGGLQCSGDRILSILNLFQGDQIKITFTLNGSAGSPAHNSSIRSNNVSDNGTHINSSMDYNSGTTLESEKIYTMETNGSFDVNIGRYIRIFKIEITSGSTNRTEFDTSGKEGDYYYQGTNYPFYRCQFSSRNFNEPYLSVYPSTSTVTYRIETVSTPTGKEPAVLNGSDVMMKNLGVCKVTATGNNGQSSSYILEIWDNIASTSVTDITNGKRFAITGAGVLQNRTIGSVPGIVMSFSVTDNGVEPNTTVSYSESGHFVSFTNDNNGWWDRVPHDNSTSPTNGTFYSFTATAKGKLKFGGIKKDASGAVYLVKIKTGYPQAELFQGNHTVEGYNVSGPTGYLDNVSFPSISDDDYKITTDGIELNTGETYFLQGEANEGENRWAPYLLEWFSYELDNDLRINKNFTVANKTGYEIANDPSTPNTYVATDVNVTVGSGYTIAKEFKEIYSADVSINSAGHLQFSDINFKKSGENKMGGAIKVTITQGSNSIVFTLTIPYGKHVWDFRKAADQGENHGDWSFTDDNTETGLIKMMTDNTSDWKLVWKVTTYTNNEISGLNDPIVAANSSIEGNNAFYMDNTTGLVFVAGPRSFGAHDETNNSLGLEAKKTLTYTSTTKADHLWLKGESTIYFPGVSAGDYIKIYTYRHSDNKGENFKVSNLNDLDGKEYNSSHIIKLRGLNENRRPGYTGDDIKGAAIFRVPNTYNATNDISSIPALTLSDDGWASIYKIEITNTYVPDLVLTMDGGKDVEGEICNLPVDYNGKYGSIVVRKHKNGEGTYDYETVTKYFTATPGNTRCQSANTCRYEVIPTNVSVVTTHQDFTSDRTVHYNKLKLDFTGGNGFVKIVQREIANNIGVSTTIGEGSTSTKSTNEYTIDKNEYYLAVGELTVQDYPYTWDFNAYNKTANHAGVNGTNSTTTALTSSNDDIIEGSFGKWKWKSDNTGWYQVLHNEIDMVGHTTNKIEQPLAAQGAQLVTAAKLEETTVMSTIIESEGLGIARPYSSVNGSHTVFYTKEGEGFGKYPRSFKIYDMPATDGISNTWNEISGIGEITIPEVDDGMYIFVKASAAPTVKAIDPLEVASDENLSVLANTDDNFKVKSGVFLYKNETGISRDITVSFASGTSVEIIAVTNIVKAIGPSGYATESRDHDIDHTYQDKLTTHPVRAYAIQTDGGGAYTYQDKFEVRKLGPVKVVPQKTGIVLHEDLESGASHSNFSSPLFYPAVNVTATRKASSEDADEDLDILDNNWMAPSIAWTTETVDGVERVTGGSASEGVLFYQAGAFKTKSQTGLGTGDWCTKFILASTYYEYTKEDGAETGTISEGKGSVSTAGFYCFKYTDGVPQGTSNANNPNFLAGNKAFLLIKDVPAPLWAGGSGSSSSRGVLYIDLEELEGGKTTDINLTKNDNASKGECGQEVYYTLSGSRINGRPNVKGIYICNGKKVTIK